MREVIHTHVDVSLDVKTYLFALICKNVYLISSHKILFVDQLDTGRFYINVHSQTPSNSKRYIDKKNRPWYEHIRIIMLLKK